MKLPCEMGVWYVLPSIRACLVTELIEMGLPQKKVACMLGITPAAVCQYAARKRGFKVDFRSEVKKAIQDLAGDIARQEVENLIYRYCDICTMVRAENSGCLHCLGETNQYSDAFHR